MHFKNVKPCLPSCHKLTNRESTSLTHKTWNGISHTYSQGSTQDQPTDDPFLLFSKILFTADPKWKEEKGIISLQSQPRGWKEAEDACRESRHFLLPCIISSLLLTCKKTVVFSISGVCNKNFLLLRSLQAAASSSSILQVDRLWQYYWPCYWTCLYKSRSRPRLFMP